MKFLEVYKYYTGCLIGILISWFMKESPTLCGWHFIPSKQPEAPFVHCSIRRVGGLVMWKPMIPCPSDVWDGFDFGSEQRNRKKSKRIDDWLVVEPSHLKNMCQIGSSPQVRLKTKNCLKLNDTPSQLYRKWLLKSKSRPDFCNDPNKRNDQTK